MKTITMTPEQYKRQLVWTHNKAIFKFVKLIKMEKIYKGKYPSIATIEKIAKDLYKELKG